MAGFHLENSGKPVEYFRCGQCGFIFTTYFDAYTNADFVENIYNADYEKVDPLFATIRPALNAEFLTKVFNTCYGPTALPAVLDFGSGSGQLAANLKNILTIDNYDPLSGANREFPKSLYDVVFSAEVLEHVCFPRETLTTIAKLLKPSGILLFSTMVQPSDMASIKGTWWYMSPRNGHISLFTPSSLENLLAQESLSYVALSDEWHLGFFKGAVSGVDIRKLKMLVAELPTGFIPLPE